MEIPPRGISAIEFDPSEARTHGLMTIYFGVFCSNKGSDGTLMVRPDEGAVSFHRILGHGNTKEIWQRGPSTQENKTRKFRTINSLGASPRDKVESKLTGRRAPTPTKFIKQLRVTPFQICV
jgi:hypothetical protein